MPKFHLLYFKHMLDIALAKFFSIYNDDFQKVNGKYVLSQSMSKSKLLCLFKELVLEELSKHLVKYERLQPSYFMILGSCFPKDNLLLDFKDSCYFPKKLSNLLASEYNIKYLLKEKDIDIDILKFNDMCFELFNMFFTEDIVAKNLGKDYKNVFFIQHSKLDCYMLFKVIKFLYGKRNCINMYKEKLANEKLPLVAVNDIIGKYINKSSMNKSQKLKTIAKEIQQYIDERIREL